MSGCHFRGKEGRGVICLTFFFEFLFLLFLRCYHRCYVKLFLECHVAGRCFTKQVDKVCVSVRKWFMNRKWCHDGCKYSLSFSKREFINLIRIKTIKEIYCICLKERLCNIKLYPLHWSSNILINVPATSRISQIR